MTGWSPVLLLQKTTVWAGACRCTASVALILLLPSLTTVSRLITANTRFLCSFYQAFQLCFIQMQSIWDIPGLSWSHPLLQILASCRLVVCAKPVQPKPGQPKPGQGAVLGGHPASACAIAEASQPEACARVTQSHVSPH